MPPDAPFSIWDAAAEEWVEVYLLPGSQGWSEDRPQPGHEEDRGTARNAWGRPGGRDAQRTVGLQGVAETRADATNIVRLLEQVPLQIAGDLVGGERTAFAPSVQPVEDPMNLETPETVGVRATLWIDPEDA